MNNSFEISWVSLCRIFGTLAKRGYEKNLESTLMWLYNQCSKEQKNKLKELYPELVKEIKEAMMKSEGYKDSVMDGA